MATEAERYLAKARESLASARADVRAKRYNSAANRAYYAAFQAAVAALIREGIRPARKKNDRQGNWEHRFVMSQFSGKLVWRRRIFVESLGKVLDDLFEDRLMGDYQTADVSERRAKRSTSNASQIVGAVAERIDASILREGRAEYRATMTTKIRKKPEDYIEDVKNKMLENYPDLDFEVYKRGPRDFTIEVYGDYEDMWEVRESLGDMKARILAFHDVWIVVLPFQRQRDY